MVMLTLLAHAHQQSTYQGILFELPVWLSIDLIGLSPIVAVDAAPSTLAIYQVMSG